MSNTHFHGSPYCFGIRFSTWFAVNITILDFYGKNHFLTVIIAQLPSFMAALNGAVNICFVFDANTPSRIICKTVCGHVCRPQDIRGPFFLLKAVKENNGLVSRSYSTQCIEEEQSGKCLLCDLLEISSALLWCFALLLPSSSFFGLISCTSAAVIYSHLAFYYSLT